MDRKRACGCNKLIKNVAYYETFLGVILLGSVGLLQADPNTDLHDAIMDCNLARVEAALRAGADVNYQDELQNTPLLLAINFTDALLSEHRKACSAVVKSLVAAGADINTQNIMGVSPWQAAVRYANRPGAQQEILDNLRTVICNCGD